MHLMNLRWHQFAMRSTAAKIVNLTSEKSKICASIWQQTATKIIRNLTVTSTTCWTTCWTTSLTS